MTLKVTDGDQNPQDLKTRLDSSEHVSSTDVQTLPSTNEQDIKDIRTYTRDVVPGRKGFAVTPNDSTDLPDGTCDGLYVGSGGDVDVHFADQSTAVLLKNVGTGAHLPYAIKRVLAAGTTATSIVAVHGYST